MLTEFTSSTKIWRYIERPRRQQRTREEKSSAGRITHLLGQGGVTNMERFNSMTEKEIMEIPGINKKSYRYIQEALEDSKSDYGNRVWVLPDFDSVELGIIIHELSCRKLPHYYDLVQDFLYWAQDEVQHPQIEVMERIYYKLESIHRDEFAVIMAGKGVNLDDYGL